MKKYEIDHFLESKISQKKKKILICGIGRFDVDFPCGIWIDGKCHHHSAYEVWRHMIQRCYKPNTEQDARIYAGCIVCDEWLYFSNFLAFWKAYYREGCALDKDLLIKLIHQSIVYSFRKRLTTLALTTPEHAMNYRRV